MTTACIGLAALVPVDRLGDDGEVLALLLRAGVLAEVLFAVVVLALVDLVTDAVVALALGVVFAARDDRVEAFGSVASVACLFAALRAGARLVVPLLADDGFAAERFEDVLSPVCAIAESFPSIPPQGGGRRQFGFAPLFS